MASFFAGLFGGSAASASGASSPSSQGGGAGRSGRPSFGSGGLAGSQSAQPRPSYSFAQLQQLYSRLSQFRESDLEKGAGDAVVETVRQITEALIWGEQNDTNFFDFFCEKSILSDFIRVLGLQKAPKKVKVQLLQTLSILVQNIRRQTSVYFLLSNNQVNKLIAMPLDYTDEEILAYYITLLKSLAMRLDNETVKFFFVQHPERAFPLYTEATKFLRHREQMVRAAVRTITLQVYGVGDPAMHTFVRQHAERTYFRELADYLRDLWIKLDEIARNGGEEQVAALQHQNEVQQDLLIYLSDILELGVAPLNKALAERLLSGAMYPLLLGSLQRSSAPLTPGRDFGRTLAPSVALFLLRQVLETIRNPVVAEPVATLLLQPLVPPGLAATLESSQSADVNYAGAELVHNVLRDHFLRCLRSEEDQVYFLACAVLLQCIRGRDLLPADFLETARVLPGSATPTDAASSGPPSRQGAEGVVGVQPSERKGGFLWSSLPTSSSRLRLSGSSSGSSRATQPGQPLPSGAGPTGAENPLEVLHLVLRGLHRVELWSVETLQVMLVIFRGIFMDPVVCQHASCQTALANAVRSALRATAQLLRQLLEAAGPSVRRGGATSDDSILDLLLEEWELHLAPSPELSILCSSPRCILNASARSAPAKLGPAASRKQHTKVIRTFLQLRRLLLDHEEAAGHLSSGRRKAAAGAPAPEKVPRGATTSADEEASPLQVEEETADGLHENMSLEVGTMERIVCSIATPHGKHTRYFLLHNYWLLLVQPDLTCPGWMVITTLWPLRSVQSMIDRSDPRTMQVGMHMLHATVSSGGEASAYRPQEPSFMPAPTERTSSYLTLALSFENVKQCHNADRHVQTRRREVRTFLLEKALAFVDRYCRELPAEAAGGPNGSELDGVSTTMRTTRSDRSEGSSRRE